MGYLIGLVAAVFLGAGFVLQQDAAQRVPKGEFLRPRLLLDLLRKPRWLAGIATMITGQLVSVWVLGHLMLSQAEPLLATNLLFALLLAIPLSGQAVHKSEVIGAVVLIAAVTSLSLARTASSPQVSVGSASYWPYAAAVIVAGVLTFAEFGRRSSGTQRAVLTGTSAGLVFGIQDALTRRSMHILYAHQLSGLLTSWPIYSLAGIAVVGLWLMQSAFNAAPLHASLPAITAAEPVAGIVLGIVVFGDKVHDAPALIALQVCGFIALLGGVVLVARAPALTGLSKVHLPHHDQAPPTTQSPPPAQKTPSD